MTKLALVAAALLAVMHVTGQPGTLPPAQSFWQQHGAGPGAREADAVEGLRVAVRAEVVSDVVVAAR